MQVCRESRSWLFRIASQPLWTVRLPHHAGSAKPSSQRSLSLWDPVSSVLYGSIQYSHGYIPSRRCSFCIFSPGSSHPSRKLLTLSSSTGNSDPVDDFFYFIILSTHTQTHVDKLSFIPWYHVKLLSFLKISLFFYCFY